VSDGATGGQAPSPEATQPGWLERVAGSIQRAAVTAGRPFVGFVTVFGEHFMLLAEATAWLFRRPFRRRQLLDQMEFIGVGSLPIVLLVGLFSGAVSTLQAIGALRIFNQERFVGATVGISLAQEFAPVFTGLMVTARAGSGMATELGSMRITEQIDSLTTFAVNPVQYLITPRLLASIFMVPVLTMAFNIIGLAGGYAVAIWLNHLDFGLVADLFRYWVTSSASSKLACSASRWRLRLASKGSTFAAARRRSASPPPAPSLLARSRSSCSTTS
jgi:phospholipid/cholesterol/gamma-HCH transport system permease protein